MNLNLKNWYSAVSYSAEKDVVLRNTCQGLSLSSINVWLSITRPPLVEYNLSCGSLLITPMSLSWHLYIQRFWKHTKLFYGAHCVHLCEKAEHMGNTLFFLLDYIFVTWHRISCWSHTFNRKRFYMRCYEQWILAAMKQTFSKSIKKSWAPIEILVYLLAQSAACLFQV